MFKTSLPLEGEGGTACPAAVTDEVDAGGGKAADTFLSEVFEMRF